MKHEYPDIYYFLTDWLLRRTAHVGVRRIAQLDAAVATDVGAVREENQDRAVIVRGRDSEGKAYLAIAVADGVGGMKSGAACAALTLGAFIGSLAEEACSSPKNSSQWINRSIKIANNFVFNEFRGSGGSTLVAVLMKPNQPIFWVSVGDSRVYRIRRGELTQVSKDDTIAGYLGKNVDVPNEQTRLLQYVGIGNEMEPNFGEIDFLPEDKILLTTDGAHYISHVNGLLQKIIEHASDPGVCVKRLLDVAKWSGSTDNATVAMVSLSELNALDIGGRHDFVEVCDAYGEVTYRQESLKRIHVPIDVDQGKIYLEQVHGREDLEDSSAVKRVPGFVFKELRVSKKDHGKERAKKLKLKIKKTAVDDSGEVAPQLQVEFLKKKE